MKKILVLMLGFLLITANLYAADGDVIAEGDAGTGSTTSTDTGKSGETSPAQTETSPDLPPSDETPPTQSPSASPLSAGEGAGTSSLSEWASRVVQISPAGNSGAAITSIPIIVPPGRKGMAPNLSLTYNSNGPNGWVGVGWGLDMGAIQRNTKRGVNYNANDYVVMVNGSTSELVSRGDWGTNYYGAKIEGAFSKYQKISDTAGWIVTTKDGTKYFYGTTVSSRQDSNDPQTGQYRVFKWCLDKVQDTNGNYMTVSYIKDQGEIYLDRIDYTGNGSLSLTNYVKFYPDDGTRTDAPPMYTTNALVKTAYRLKTVAVYSKDGLGVYQLVRAYKLEYDADLNTPGSQYSSSTGRSLLGRVELFGSDVTLDGSGTVTGGTALPAMDINYQQTVNDFIQIQYSLNHWNGARVAAQGDFNGDGKSDFLLTDSSDSGYIVNPNTATYVHLSNGDGTFTQIQYSLNHWNGARVAAQGDFNGDGKSDFLLTDSSNSGYIVNPNTATYVHQAAQVIPDILSTINNGIGSTTTITYQPSSAYDNCIDIDGKNICLPFVIQTLSSVTIDDGNGVSSATNYTYSGGYFDYADREFRGFQYAKATASNGATTETWFKQDSIFKGLPYEQITKDSSGNIYTRSYNTYQYTNPYTGVNFPYLSQKNDYVYDGTSTRKEAATTFTYDSYGNVTRKYFYGDVNITGDERDEYTEYNYDTINWLVSFPSTTYVKDSGGVTKAQAWFTYDTKGNLLTKTAWLNGGTNPVITYTYDSYGNQASVKDARNNTTTIAYDSTYTYPTTTTNPLGHISSATYDLRFGKPLTETDPNNNTTTYQYDVFGRLTKAANPNDRIESTYGTVSYYYLDFGTVGSQRVVTYATEQSGTSNYIWKEIYFDGLGRTIETRAEGPDSKVIAQRTLYDNRGQVSYASLPYFEGIETERWTYFEYDPIGRVKKITNPDGTYVTKSYLKGRTTLEDANRHQKIEEKDVYGRLIKVEEYTGVSPSFTLYTTTTYQYDVLGNLIKVTDTAGNQTTMVYDTLSRKLSMTDPDMGYWIYQYDVNGNLTSQKDAKNQTILFTYDALNRITKKDYPWPSTDANYYYDETTSTNYKGRLTRVTDASGTEKYYYDKLGRITKTIKTVSGVNRTIETTYDALSRTTSIKYPDNEIVSYSYDTGSNLSQITGYATYSNYNALGQPGTITYANGVSTTYQYYTSNNRLYSITTNNPALGLQNISYSYDNNGNITGITDYLDSNRNQGFIYDDLNRLTQAQSTAYGTLTYSYNQIGNMTYNSQVGNYTYPTNGIRPHAVTQAGANTYQYDANGNMTSGAGRTIAYNYDNMPSSITKSGTTATFVYDYVGQRVKKTVSSVTTVYIGKLYECTSGVCTKYIFGGSNRIASKKSSTVYYYHTDHLGSSSIITDSAGSKVEELYYYPYGGTRIDSGSISVKHKYTSQELDGETGLYNYGARYYDPILGRFISADTIVQNFSDPQTLNRYSYARNNPVIYIDPSGHGWQEWVGAGVGAVIGAIAAERAGGDWWKGAIVGAVAGYTGTWAGTWAYTAAGGSGWFAAIVGGAVGGATGGAVSGGLNAAMYGGNVWQGIYRGAGNGALYGAIGGMVGGAVGNVASYYGISNVYVQGLLQIGSGSVAGGIAAELTGGTFAQGAQGGAIGAAASVVANLAAAKFFAKNTKTGEMSEEKAGNDLTVTFEEWQEANSVKVAGGIFLWGRPWLWFRPRPGLPLPDNSPRVPWDPNWSEWNPRFDPFDPPPMRPKPPFDWYKWKPEPPHTEPPYKRLEA